MDVKSDLQVLQQHHLTLNFLHIAVIVIALFMVGGMYVHEVKREAQQDAKVTQMLEQYKTDTAKLQVELKASFDQRLQDQQDEARRQQDIARRDLAAAKQQKDVKNPDNTVPQVAADLNTFLGIKAVIEPDNNLGIGKQDAQSIIGIAIDGKRDAADLIDKTDQYDKAQASVTSLTSDLAKVQGQAKECEGTVAELKKVKKPSKFKTVLGKVGYAVAGFVIGKALAGVL